MRKYYYKDAAGQQQGPFTIEELAGKNISPNTAVWYDTLPKWTTAAEVDELKNIITTDIPQTASAIIPVTEIQQEASIEQAPPLAEPLIETPVVQQTVAATAVKPTSKPTVTKTISSNKKSTAWISWVLSILVLGAAGYYVYQDIEKGKSDNVAALDAMEKDMKVDVSNDPAQTDSTIIIDNSTSLADTATTEPVTTDPVTTTEPTTTTTTIGTTEADKKAAAKKKLEEEKKKAALAKQKADDIKKQELAAQAALAKELQYRNSWSKYITVGSLTPTPLGDDGVNAFDVPVYNATDAVLDKVTIRIDYYKKEKKDKIVGSETITVYKVPARSGMVGKAPENKRSRKVVATIVGINSRKLHLCYPQSGSNAADPYYCN